MGEVSSVVFLDSGLISSETNLVSIPKDMRVVALESDHAAIPQIANAVSKYKNLDGIHIISHGSQGNIHFGNVTVDSESLAHYKAELAIIGQSISETGDIYLYGCNVASGEQGAAFLENFAALTQADIAASDDLTGSQSLGGDWVLEKRVGEIEKGLSVFSNLGLDNVLLSSVSRRNYLLGSDATDEVEGQTNVDVVDHIGGDDLIREATRALFFDNIRHFDVQSLSGVTHITGNSGASAQYAVTDDVLVNVEQAQFLDKTLALDTTKLNVIVGNTAAETLEGTPNADVIEHRGGDDLIDGRGGNDIALYFDRVGQFSIQTLAGVTHITGASGAKTPYANTNDLLVNVEEALFLNGTRTLATTQRNVVIGSTAAEELDGTAKADVFEHRGGGDVINGRAGDDVAVFFDYIGRFDVQTIAGVTHITGAQGALAPYAGTDEILVNVERVRFLNGALNLKTTEANQVIGTAGAEELEGTANSDVFEHRGGADVINGRAGDDVAVFFDYAGRFDIQTLAGITHITGSEGAAGPYAGTDDVLVNVERAEFLNQKVNLNTTSRNVLIGTAGADDLMGSAGSDVFEHRGGADVINGLGGTDVAVFFDLLGRFDIQTLSGVTHVTGAAGAEAPYAETDDLLVNVENVRFLNGVRTLSTTQLNPVIGTAGAEQLNGTVNDDVLEHRGGGDVIDGRGGKDVAVFFDYSGRFDIQTLAGVTHIRGSAGAAAPYTETDDILINVEQAEFVNEIRALETTSRNVVVGTSGADEVAGTNNRDVFEHLGGADVINGRGGKDVAVFFDYGGRFDVQTLSGVTYITGAAGAEAPYANTSDLLVNVEQAQFLNYSKTLDTTSLNTVIGTPGGEELDGTVNDDVIEHRGGADVIDGRGGTDVALFFDLKGAFDVQTLLGVTHITGSSGAAEPYADTDDLLVNVEQAQFLNHTLNLNTTTRNVVIGTAATDDLDGTKKADVFEHRGGADVIDGHEGRDVALFFDYSERFDIQTLSGVTHVIGSPGAESPYAEVDDLLVNVERVLFLDKGRDLATTQANIVIGSTGAEDLEGTVNDDAIEHRGGDDIIDGRAGIDTAVFFDFRAAFNIRTLAGVTHITGGPGAMPSYAETDDILVNVEKAEFLNGTSNLTTTKRNVHIGTSGIDQLDGTSNDDVFEHRGGNDVIDGRGGKDVALFFDDIGRFQIQSLSGVTHISGAPGAEEPYTDTGDILVNVENARFLNGFERLATTQLNPIIGTEGSDNLTGTDNEDVLEHRAGADIVDGGDGADVAVFFDQSDRFQINSLAGVTHIVGRAKAAAAYADTDDLLLNVEQAQFTDTTINLNTSTRNVVVGATGAEELEGTNKADVFEHRGGGDVIDGRGGSDVALFFDKSDRFRIQTLSGVSHVSGNVKAEAPYNGGDDLLVNVERVRFLDKIVNLAGTQLNVVIGSTAADELDGTANADVIEHRDGSDVIDGQGGDDIALFFEKVGRFNVKTLSGVTHVVGSSSAEAPYAGSDDVLVNVEEAQFLDQRLNLDTTKKNVVVGAIGDEDLEGTVEADIFDGLGGNDDIDGKQGNDKVVIFDKRNNFRISTQSGVTHVIGLATSKTPYTGKLVRLTNVEKVQFLNETIVLGAGNAEIKGTPNADVMVGSDDIEILSGLQRKDRLLGKGSDDVLNGNLGNDKLIGGLGKDILTGGPGADRFLYRRAAQGDDEITDFTPGSDRVQIVGKNFSNLGKGTLQAQNFVSNTTGLASDANDYLVFNTTTNTLYYDSDGNGSGGPLALARFTNGIRLQHTDISVV